MDEFFGGKPFGQKRKRTDPRDSSKAGRALKTMVFGRQTTLFLTYFSTIVCLPFTYLHLMIGLIYFEPFISIY
jgi:hypothetical protein